MNKEHKVSVYDMTKQLNLKEVIPEINTREIFITQAEINRPALQLAGFFEHFSNKRIQIIGNVEYLYLQEIRKDDAAEGIIFERLFSAGIPCLVFCNNLEPNNRMTYIAKKYNVPILISRETTSEFMAEVIRWLGVELAPSISIHGVLVEGFGDGIL